jgi:uncharacterized protein
LKRFFFRSQSRYRLYLFSEIVSSQAQDNPKKKDTDSIGAKPPAMNQLHLETSPYLLQHANNPIHWQSWNTTTLNKAKNQNKLIIISIGYSACHWCHVMEHETFENQTVAQIMNPNYISIKVDREERPDVDAIYMKAIQIMTNQGGWPLNVVCLPDGRPVWGGTYFKQPDWINALQQLQALFENQPEQLEEYAQKLHQGIKTIDLVEKNTTEITQEKIAQIVQNWSRSFDREYGGYQRAPKFMMPNNYQFLQRYAHQTKNQNLLDFVDLTLTKMAYGGIFDTLEGGFSRYSVDLKWHVPHFEKMLYDNAQLVSLYSNAYKRTQNKLYKEVVEKTLKFVENEFLNLENAFYSALDADSINPLGNLEEGSYYVWQKTELQALLKEDFEQFSIVFNINPFGYWEHENYVLIQSDSLKNTAQKLGITETELETKKILWEKKLTSERKKRPKPRLDDKTITSWNALMISGYIDAYSAFENTNYLETALKNARFIIEKLISKECSLVHTYKQGKTSSEGFLEDYAHVIQAFIKIYQATFDEEFLNLSQKLTHFCLENFFDNEQQFFAFNSYKSKQLIAQHFDIDDNVISSSNSVMANNLHQLAIYFNNSEFEKKATQMLQNIIPNIDYGSAYSNWMWLWLNFDENQKELAICGKNAIENLKKINTHYLPNILVAGTTQNTNLPFLEYRFSENENLFYVCKNKACMMPNDNFEEVFYDLNS